MSLNITFANISPGLKISNDAVGVLGGAFSTVDLCKSSKSGYPFAVQFGQTLNSAASFAVLSQATRTAVPFLSIASGTYSGFMTFQKVVGAQFDEGRFGQVEVGDYISLASSVASVGLGLLVLETSVTVGGVAILGVSVAAGALGVINSESAREAYDSFLRSDFITGLSDNFLKPVWRNFFRDSNSVYRDSYIAPDMSLANLSEIQDSYESNVFGIGLNDDGSGFKGLSVPLIIADQMYHEAGGAAESCFRESDNFDLSSDKAESYGDGNVGSSFSGSSAVPIFHNPPQGESDNSKVWVGDPITGYDPPTLQIWDQGSGYNWYRADEDYWLDWEQDCMHPEGPPCP